MRTFRVPGILEFFHNFEFYTEFHESTVVYESDALPTTFQDARSNFLNPPDMILIKCFML